MIFDFCIIFLNWSVQKAISNVVDIHLPGILADVFLGVCHFFIRLYSHCVRMLLEWLMRPAGLLGVWLGCCITFFLAEIRIKHRKNGIFYPKWAVFRGIDVKNGARCVALSG